MFSAFVRGKTDGVCVLRIRRMGSWVGGDDVDRFGLANNANGVAAAVAVRRVASDAAFTRFDTRGDVTSRLLTSCGGGGGLSVTATNRRRFDDDLSRLPAENNRITALRNPGGLYVPGTVYTPLSACPASKNDPVWPLRPVE